MEEEKVDSEIVYDKVYLITRKSMTCDNCKHPFCEYRNENITRINCPMWKGSAV